MRPKRCPLPRPRLLNLATARVTARPILTNSLLGNHARQPPRLNGRVVKKEQGARMPPHTHAHTHTRTPSRGEQWGSAFCSMAMAAERSFTRVTHVTHGTPDHVPRHCMCACARCLADQLRALTADAHQSHGIQHLRTALQSAGTCTWLEKEAPGHCAEIYDARTLAPRPLPHAPNAKRNPISQLSQTKKTPQRKPTRTDGRTELVKNNKNCQSCTPNHE